MAGGSGSTAPVTRGFDHDDELARERWADVPVRKPGDHDGYQHHAIAHVMEALAARSGRVDDIVAVRARDLSSGWRFVGIALLLQEHGRDDVAAGLDFGRRDRGSSASRPPSR